MINSKSKLLEQVLESQAASGAFLSTVHFTNQRMLDENGFITALIIYELSQYLNQYGVPEAIERGLDFLLRCESHDQPGYFRFYPEDAYPDFIGVRLAPDADDTALFSMLLVKFGRRPHRFLHRVVQDVLAHHQLLYLPESAKPWYKDKTYLTWLDEGLWPNVVDCCVNVNVAVLLKQSGIQNPSGLSEILSMVEHGVEWAGSSEARARHLCPFYPHPIELFHAVRRAFLAGVQEFWSCLVKMRELPWTQISPAAQWISDVPVCGSLDRQIIWTSEVLQAIRKCSRL